ncbi:hypothetical protein [Nitrosovibrio sp. Nv17]|uniref:hypothetical protein n=1 Tax=Nitrosovibrio sp. Nv17 TaxID=1855339 RepID=UPI000908D49A|nr:hypothetical protein [Nitrosovibrio sp. Nv17]SFW21798.1 hypothetical protein SAMN05216414_106107 [Nitrosovibrio sp. Nv17]
MGLRFSNFGRAQIGSAPEGATGLQFSVEAGKGILFPSLGTGDYFYGTFKDASGNREIVRIEARNGDTFTIPVGGRGLDGTTARTWAAGDHFVAGITRLALEESLSNPNLAALGSLAASADTLPYFSGAGIAALTSLSGFARTLLDDAAAGEARATLGAAPSDLIPAGSVMAFFQATAPVGWTQVVAHHDRAMRIVNGPGGGTGGSVAFTAAFTVQAVNGVNSATTLTEAQIPAHQHTFYIGSGAGSVLPDYNPPDGNSMNALAYTNFTGGGGAHNHSFTGTAIDLSVRYVDAILASKD